MLKWITIGFVALVVVNVVSIVIIRRRQKKRMEEARIRGIKKALWEQQRYDTLRKLEGREGEYQVRYHDDTHLNKRREIKR